MSSKTTKKKTTAKKSGSKRAPVAKSEVAAEPKKAKTNPTGELPLKDKAVTKARQKAIDEERAAAARDRREAILKAALGRKITFVDKGKSNPLAVKYNETRKAYEELKASGKASVKALGEARAAHGEANKAYRAWLAERREKV